MIELSRKHAEMIVWHAQAEAPLEACGLLSGRGTSVLRVFPLRNEDRSEVSYHLNPEEQFRIFMEIEEVGDQLVGIYHSHPKTAAYPSPRDIEAAYYPETVYLIVSLAEETSPDLRAFRIRNGTVKEERIQWTPDERDKSSRVGLHSGDLR